MTDTITIEVPQNAEILINGQPYEIESADNQPVVDHNTPEDWVTDRSERFYIRSTINTSAISGAIDPAYKTQLWLIGNLYKTLEEAEAALELLKLDSEIKRFVAFCEKDDPVDWNDREQKKHYFCWNHYKNILDTNWVTYYRRQGVLYMTEQTKGKLLEHFTSEQIERWVKS